MSTQRHNYEYDVDSSSATAPANVVRLVGTGKRVLEIGCGPGSITKILAKESQCRVTGLELDVDAIRLATPYCEHIYQADLNAENWPALLDGTDRFDVVVAADVLEHLYDPWTTLKRMVPLIKEDGYIVISLPHAGHAAIISCLINGDFEYRNWGLLDRTHIRFFCLKNIEDLFAQANLKIMEVGYVVKQPEETEFAEQWAQLASSTQHTLRQSEHANIYQVVVKAVPTERPGAAIPLKKTTGTNKKIYLFHPQLVPSLKRAIGSHLPPKLKNMLRATLKSVGIKP